LEYLGHIISENGVATDPTKTAAMLNWPQPSSVTELRGFLGLTGYYRKFVRNYGIIAKPLTQLLKKKSFEWTAAAQQAFSALKSVMMCTPVLVLPDFTTQFVIEIDACADGVGAVLMQKGQPVAFLSKAFGEKHKHLSIYDKEFLALLMVVEKWGQYIQHQEFVIKTDHQSLSYLNEQNLHSDIQKKAMDRLMGLKFKIIYNKGKDNVSADALSRVANVMTIQGMSAVQPMWIQEVVNSYTSDVDAQQLLTQLVVLSPNEDGFSLNKRIIRYQGRIWLGGNSAIQTKLITALHESAIGGHSGVEVTYHRLKNLFFWKGMKQDVDKFVKQCIICQKAKHSHQHPHGLLQPLPIPEQAWTRVSMDFIEGLPLADKCNVIVVVVDRLTKYAHFFPVKHPYTAQSIAQILLDGVVKLHGLPQTIVSDRDPVFLSKFWQELFKVYEVKLTMSTAYQSQTDGQTERVNQCLEMYLRCAIHDSPKQWKRWLPLAELWYNAAFHSALGCSPFKALYGVEPNLVLAPTISPQIQPSLLELIQDRESHLQPLKEHLAAAQNKMKLQADRKRTAMVFQVGDKVLLKLQPYVQTSVAKRPYPKLAFKYYGPYEVLVANMASYAICSEFDFGDS
jgi:hypothetical protein